jgi:hypothetical protein
MTDNVIYGIDFAAGLRSYRISKMEQSLARSAAELLRLAGIMKSEDTSPSEMNMDEPA